MSEVAQVKTFNPVSAQPPLRWYFDPKVLEIEQRVLLDAGPKYVGHGIDGAQPRRLPCDRVDGQSQDVGAQRRRRGTAFHICRHRQATMLEGRGNAKNYRMPVAPLDLQERRRVDRAPHFPQNPCLH